MKTSRILRTTFASIFFLCAMSCNNGAPSDGFDVHIEEIIVNNGISTDLGGMQGILVSTNWVFDLGTPSGAVTSFSGRTDSGGDMGVSNARLPAKWFIGFNDARCNEAINTTVSLTQGDTASFSCITFFVGGVSLTPNPIDQTNFSSTITVQGSGFSTAYGPPTVDFRALNGTLLGTTTPSWVSADGTQLITGTVPMSGQYDGTYSLIVNNKGSDGSYIPMGATQFDSTGNPRPGSPTPPDPPLPI
jgi:hypothetical protein